MIGVGTAPEAVAVVGDTITNQVPRPDIVVPDVAPLIHLALVDELRLLHEIGGSVLLVDLVAMEATWKRDELGGAKLARWIDAGRQPASNHPVRVEATEFGRILSLACLAEPSFRAPNANEAAVVEWLATTIQQTRRPTIVLSENRRAPGIVANQGTESDIRVLTARAFLDEAERRGLINSRGELAQ